MLLTASIENPNVTIFLCVTGGSLAAVALGYWFFMSPYSQRFGSFPFRGTCTDKIVALTFDDGPNEPFTSQIATFLNTRAIKATFFQVGRCADRFPEVTTRLAKEGHVIGGHSYSHRFRHCLRWTTQSRDIEEGQRALGDLLGQRPEFFRPPWLFRHPWMLRYLRAQGLRPVSGEFVHALEIFQISPERMARRAVSKVRPGSILIFHDGVDARTGNRSQTVETVKLVVDQLLHDGFRFVTIDELLRA